MVRTWRERGIRIVESAPFRNFITFVIVLNAVALGIETYDIPQDVSNALVYFDLAVTIIFVTEISLKLLVYRLDFFREGWNIFDFVIVAASIIPGNQNLQIVRGLRVLRVLRLLRVVPMMKRIVEALFKAIPGMGAIFSVLALITYVAAVMATQMYGDTDSPEVQVLFGSLQQSAFTLFQVMTMDGWRNEVVQVVMDDGHPYAWVFFLVFIFMASFAILNLFIALIVEALQAEQEALQDQELDDLEKAFAASEKRQERLLTMVAELQQEIRDIKKAAPD